MALIIKPKGENTIEIPGADIQLQELYVRIEFAGRADGSSYWNTYGSNRESRNGRRYDRE
jgi:hypothetical protein